MNVAWRDHDLLTRPAVRRALLGALMALLIGWMVLLWWVGPRDMVVALGPHNGYLVTFVVACLGGISSLTGASFLTTVVAMNLGGLAPVPLGIAGGLGATVSDAAFLYLGRAGRTVAPARLTGKLDQWSRWLARKPRWSIPVVVLLYTAALPLPSDILLGALGLARVPFRRVVVSLLIGNCVFLTWFGYFGHLGWLWLT